MKGSLAPAETPAAGRGVDRDAVEVTISVGLVARAVGKATGNVGPVARNVGKATGSFGPVIRNVDRAVPGAVRVSDRAAKHRSTNKCPICR